MDSSHIITRYGKPNELDQLPKGTLCKTVEDGKEVYYIQINENTNNPRWEIIDKLPEE